MKELINTIKEIYNKGTNEDNLYTASKFMKHENMIEIYETLINKADNDEKLNKEEIELLKWILKLSNMIYNNTGYTTGLSDSDYDILSEYYKSLSKDESIITESIQGDTVSHKYKTLRGTLDKIYKITDEDVLKNKSQKSLEDWVKKSERRYYERTGNNINLMECDVIVMPKFDGVSCVFECDENGNLLRALTRGDTKRNEAKDITHVFKDIFVDPVKDINKPHGVKTEIMMKDSDLEKVNEALENNYKNTRSIVSAILNSDEITGTEKFLHIVPLRYSILDEDGNESEQYLPNSVYEYPYLKCKLKEVERIHEFAFNNKTVYPGLRCDGAVIRIMDEKIQKVLGRENEKQKFEVAFKYTEEKDYSEVKDIIFTTGLFGRVNPVVVIKPVKMKGNTVEKASLGSYGRYKDLALAKGDIVKVLYDIIPFVDFDIEDPKCIRSGNEIIKVPLLCSECGHELVESESGDLLYCTNKDCPFREVGKILNYCRKMNIQNISYATIDTFYKNGFLKYIEDLYTLKDKVDDILKLEGYGINKINNILDEIESNKTVIPSLLLGSIGIEGVSTKTFKKILEYMTMKEILDVSHDNNYEFFTVIPGIKKKTAKKIIDGINDNMELISFLINELDVNDEPRSKGDFSVVFTKVRDEDTEKFIEDMGGIVSDSLTKDTSILVVPAKGIKSSKVSKAEKYNIPIVAINDLKEYINKHFS